MKLEEIDAIAESSKYPEAFPKDLNIGPWLIEDERSNPLVKFDPQATNCSAFSSIHEIKDTAEIFCHSHGIQIHVGNIRYNIHNSQIIVMEAWRFDDTITYSRSDTRAARIITGILLGGPIVGTALGLASSFGKGKKHLVTDSLEIYFWDIETKQKQWISLQYGKDKASSELFAFVELWKEQKHINQETNRKAIGDEHAGISANSEGCLSSIIVAISTATTIGVLYSFISGLLHFYS